MAPLTLPTALVDSHWLSHHLNHPDLVILDASWYMPAAQRDGEHEWQQKRIANARFFDFDRIIKDHDNTLPHMLPPPEQFAQQVAALGISNHSVVVVYDGSGIFAAPRAWWMFKAMGHDQVAVLNGGLPAWIEQSYPVEVTPPTEITPSHFIAHRQDNWIADASQVSTALAQADHLVLDARSRDRFSGHTPDPRPEVRAGHMPGAYCLPFTELISHGHLLPTAALAEKLAPLLNDKQQLVCSCGSGVTAAILALAAYLVGHREIAVYDGSWCEWGATPSLPVVTDLE